jgi:hypothetical protein
LILQFLNESKKTPKRILPAEPQKETFVFLRNVSDASTIVGVNLKASQFSRYKLLTILFQHPQIPAQEMSVSKTAGITMTEKSTLITSRQPCKKKNFTLLESLKFFSHYHSCT